MTEVRGQRLQDRISQLISEGKYEEVIAECDRSLELNPSVHEQSVLLRFKARALLATGAEWEGKAIGCLKDALTLAEDGSEEWGKVLAALTAAYATLGRWSSCQRYRDAFVGLLKKQEAPSLLRFYPDVEFNLAVAFHNVERLDEAGTAYMVALDAARKSNDPYVRELIPLIYHNLSDVFQEYERHEEAYRMIKENDLPDEVYGAQTRNRKAVYALYRGDLDAAALWVESGLGHPALDQKTKSALYLTKAKILKAAGQTTEAYQWALEARRLAADLPTLSETLRASLFLKELS